mgnify:CR=1 FL=1
MKNFRIKFAKYLSIVWPFGLIPIAQGTITSFLAACIGFLINIYIGSEITLLLAILLGILGLWTTKIYLEKNNKKDPSEVVIDEFSGQLIATSFAGISPLLNILAFLSFRFFDILKPSLIKKAENLEGALGVMMDDWIAGIVSALLILIFSILFSYENSWILI